MVIEPQVSYSLLPSQQQLLLRIQHLVTLESNLVLISGRKGAGKYTIASALLEQYGSEFSLAWITCHDKSSTDSLRQQLLTQLLPQGLQDPSLSLHQHLSVNNPDGPLRWLIVVNQAELMGNPLLVELWGLVEHCRQHPELNQHISVVLFAEPVWARQVAQEMTGITGTELPVLQVPALSLAERKQLFVHLQTRLDDEELDVELTERQLNEQEGLPGEVVAMFEPTPTEEVRHEEDDVEPSPFRLPKKAWVFALAILPALAILLWAYQGEEKPESQRRPAPKPSLSKPAPDLLKPHEVNKLLNEPKDKKSLAQQEVEKLPEPVTQVTLTADSEDESQKQRVEVDDATIQAIEKQQAEQSNEAEKEIPASEAVSEKPAGHEAEEAPKANVTLEQTLPSKPNVTLEQTLPSKPISPAQAKPKLWWQQLDESHFVLQLVLMSTESGVKAFAQQHGLAFDPLFRYYPANRGGKVVYIGTYGDYSAKESARAGAVILKRKYSQLSPWPKSATAVKQEAVPLD